MTVERTRPRLVLVEDRPAPATALAFEEAGYDVVVAPGGEHGFESVASALREARVAALVSAGPAGFELCRRIKADPRTQNVPVLVLTGDTDPVSVLRGLEAGADGFVTEDHPPEAIVERIRHATSAHGGSELPAERFELFGETFTLRASPRRLLGMLVSAFEDGVRRSERLRHVEASLRERDEAIARAHQALREANEEKQRFVHAAAHDLRNPAGLVRSIAELILDGDAGPVSDDQKDLLGRVVRQAQTLLDSSQDLLDGARQTGDVARTRSSSARRGDA